MVHGTREPCTDERSRVIFNVGEAILTKGVSVLPAQERIDAVATSSVEMTTDLRHRLECMIRQPSLQTLDERGHVAWAVAQQG